MSFVNLISKNICHQILNLMIFNRTFNYKKLSLTRRIQNMFTFLSVISVIKDYVEIVHKLIESNPNIELNTYYDFGIILTYIVLSFKNFILNFISFNWLMNIWNVPILIPNITSSIISEVSILNGYFHNLFTFLENPISYGNQNTFVYCLEKFTIGIINSLFLCLPTSTAHIITIRRFVIQGLEAGYISGLGAIAGNLVWITSIICGFRFLVIPWLSLDIFRYILGFTLLVKYMWDCYNEKRTVIENLSKRNIFLLTFLLAFTEQTSIFPFITNLSLGADPTVLESFSSNNFSEFLLIHVCYLAGILLGSLSLLHFSCWFWENPGFKLYMWALSSFKMSTNTYYKYLNFFFLYLTMICTVCSIPYFGLDYTLTNPVGLISNDRILEGTTGKSFPEISFLTTKGSDRNTRINRGRHMRREKWKRRLEKLRMFDTRLYDQGIYDLFTIEDFNYGFDRFWLRRKIKRREPHYRFFPRPWMISFKKQALKPQLESFNAARIDFFRLIFEQAYHPSFHERKSKNKNPINLLFNKEITENNMNDLNNINTLTDFSRVTRQIKNTNLSLYATNIKRQKIKNYVDEYSALRKLTRKINQRINKGQIALNLQNNIFNELQNSTDRVYSKRWKNIFSKFSHRNNLKNNKILLNRLSKELLLKNKNTLDAKNNSYTPVLKDWGYNEAIIPKDTQTQRVWGLKDNNISDSTLSNRLNTQKNLSKKDRQILSYRSFLISQSTNSNDVKKLENQVNSIQGIGTSFHSFINEQHKTLTLLHPLKFYLQKNKAFQRKLKFYGTKIYRNFQVENNAPYFRVMMRRIFYHYKPTRRWRKTFIRTRLNRRRRKHSRTARIANVNKNNKAFLNVYNQQKNENENLQNLNGDQINNSLNMNNFSEINKIQKPTHSYSLATKKLERYRQQIYKDVFRHWYHSPFNRLLLKLDIDSFIRRQPFSHFVTKKEENLLHLRRFLLSEHYNTLRWYTYMQHYETMKNKIGGTKSFANRIYNQQFQGTFKKIRHLFALTPSTNQPYMSIQNLNQNGLKNATMRVNGFDPDLNSNFKILKFDQLLYNEFPNIGNKSNVQNSFIHEELLNNYTTDIEFKDLMNQSSEILKLYILQSIPIRQALIRKFLEDKNYSELTKFLWKGEKIRGIAPLSNETNFLKQENNLLYSQAEQKELKDKQSQKIQMLIKDGAIQKTLWINLLKQSKKLVYKRRSLKKYLTKKMGSYARRQKSKQNKLKKRIGRIEKWLVNNNQTVLKLEKHRNVTSRASSMTQNKIYLTTAVRKAIKESIAQTNITNTLAESASNISIKNPNKFFLKREQISNYLKNQLKSKKLVTTYSLTKFQNSISDINERIHLNNSPSLFESPQITNYILTKTKYNIEKITKFNLKPFTNALKNLYGQSTFFILKERNNKDLIFWRKREKRMRLIRRKKRSRHQFKKLRQFKTIPPLNLEQSDINLYNQNFNYVNPNIENSMPRKKTDLETKWTKFELNQRFNFWNKTKTEINTNSNKLNRIFGKDYKRKKRRHRGFSMRLGYRPVRKVRKNFNFKLAFSREVKNNPNLTKEEKKIKIFQMRNQKSYNNMKLFSKNGKKRKRRKKKHRFWRKIRRPNYFKKTQKKTKRYRSALGQIRWLAKKYKKIQNYSEIRKWWWQNFLPNFQSKMDLLWELQTNTQLKENISKLSTNDILKRDKINYVNDINTERVIGEKKLQIGNKDYKPLNIPEAIRIRQNIIENNSLNFDSQNNRKQSLSLSNTSTELQNLENKTKTTILDNSNILNQIYENILVPKNLSSSELSLNKSKFMFAVNPIPFYAGWDENERKFVVTNRLLAKNKASYEFNLSANENTNNFSDYSTLKNLKLNKFDFKNFPLEGLNSGTLLYSRVFFTTYDPDQFFAEGIDGFAPIGWRRFKFRHSIKTIKPLLVTTQTFTNQNFLNPDKQNLLSYKINQKLLNTKNPISQNNIQKENFDKYQKRRILKNRPKRDSTRRVRSRNYGAKIMLWFASGSLTQQILPAHYIYVFYKRYRLTNDRYIHRRLRKNKKEVPFSLKNINKTLTDLTLRRRIKPRRRYHRKNSSTETLRLSPRRRAFRILRNTSNETSQSITRPSSKFKTTASQVKTNISSKINKRVRNKIKRDPQNTRIRRLRRRVPMQMIRTGMRYKPYHGGFIWPGDYFQLELLKARKLITQKDTIYQNKFQKQTKKKRRKRKSLVRRKWPLPIQPKKYLLEKHNLKVLKRRLKKAQNLNKMNQKLNELNFLLNN